MRLPESGRAIYRRNPLVDVSCQLNFPRNLEIETQIPAAFQRKVRDTYPIFSTRAHIQIELSSVEGGEGAKPDTALKQVRSNVYDFASADQSWKSSLAGDYALLTTTRYERWEQFRQRIEDLLQATNEVYQPPFLTRIGLRYRDVFKRTNLANEATTPWRQLLHPHVSSFLGTESIDESAIAATQSTTQFRMHGAMLVVNTALVLDKETQEQGFLIDTDMFREGQFPTRPGEIIGILEDFHTSIWRFFRWCITERLHNAMEPNLVG